MPKVLTPWEAYLKQWEADYTPPAVVHQGLQAALEYCDVSLCRTSNTSKVQFIDPSAGSGVFSSIFSDEYARVTGTHDYTITNIEPREEEHANLAVSSDIYYQGTFEEWRQSIETYWPERPQYDFIATNPPFSKLAPKKGDGWIPTLLGMLTKYGSLIIYAKDELGQRSKAGARLFDKHQPNYQFRVVGPVSHRADNKADSRCYSFWMWNNNQFRGRGWKTINLPMLLTKDRQLNGCVPTRKEGL